MGSIKCQALDVEYNRISKASSRLLEQAAAIQDRPRLGIEEDLEVCRTWSNKGSHTLYSNMDLEDVDQSGRE